VRDAEGAGRRPRNVSRPAKVALAQREAELVLGDAQPCRDLLDVEVGAIEELVGDQAVPRVGARIIVGVGTGNVAGGDQVGVEAHADHEAHQRIVRVSIRDVVGEEEPPPRTSGDGTSAVGDGLDVHDDI
jgi:hypothetical protein